LNDFESSIGFTSYRSVYTANLNAWLDNFGDPQDFGQDNQFGDEIQGTLYNPNGAVIINGTIYMIDHSGQAWEFCNCEMYELFLQDPAAFENIQDPCVVKPKNEFQGSGQTCWDHWKNCWWENISSDRKVNQNLSFYYGPPSNPGSTQAMVEQRAFKKKWGKWRLRRIWMKVRVHGVARGSNCDVRDQGFSRDKGYDLRRRIWRIQAWFEQRTFINNEVHGQFWYTWSGTQNNRTLDKYYNGCN
jgi:hypothetical protein